jgi:hypothetical protein
LASATVPLAVAESCGKFFVFVQISEISDVTAEDMFEDMFHGRSPGNRCLHVNACKIETLFQKPLTSESW